jgi:uncharacterized protein
MNSELNDYVIRVLASPAEVNPTTWNQLLSTQIAPSPFLKHEYLNALHVTGCAVEATGWVAHFMVLEKMGAMVAGCVFYLKNHSYGEYVFDHSWANAYAQHGLNYYPKAVVSIPFTPVPGARLMACTAADRSALTKALILWCQAENLSSLHVLFLNSEDAQACTSAGMRLRHSVQFHWTNSHSKYSNFNDFLDTLSQEKRKKIRQERKKVTQAGVTFRYSEGCSIAQKDWDFFYCCYERTYLEHGNAPYLNREFFTSVANSMPENWLLFIAEKEGVQIAASLIALQNNLTGENIAYGRYWGSLEKVDCLHFEACYYQPLEWCIKNGYQRFEGGAQGEHKMARALLPVQTTSAHWLANAAFSNAVGDFLEREGQRVEQYIHELELRTPFRK